jgi:hypothetical protein
MRKDEAGLQISFENNSPVAILLKDFNKRTGGHYVITA